MRLFSNPYGFSLIELLIVIAIISILASIAIPSYQRYTQQARFTEVVVATQPYKLAVSLALQDGIASNELVNGQHGIPDLAAVTKHLAEINVKNGTITAKATKLLNDATYILKPNATGTQWAISGTCLKYNYCHTA